MEYSEKIKKGLSTGLILLAVAGVSSGVTYLITDSVAQEQIATLQKKISEHEQKEKEALVTKRISQQMEEIAYQQKSVSDKQRERAEEQSRIADMERGKALIERGLAQAAERKAVTAAAQADSMRALAENQTVIAMNNMLAAEKARAQADTLFYVSLGRSLAQTSLSKDGNGNDELASLLAYASWFYTKKYNGDVMQQDVYNSIVRASGSMITSNGSLNGNVRVMKNISINGKHTMMAVSDYGEIVMWQGEDHRVFNIDNANYRDAVIDGHDDIAYLLSSNGEVRVVDFASAFSAAGSLGIRLKQQIQLHNDLWKRIIDAGNGQLIAVGENSVAWIDRQGMKVTHVADVANISAAGLSERMLHLFGSDGHHYISRNEGEIIPADFDVIKGTVSNYYFSPIDKCHFVAMDNGMIYIFDNSGKRLQELSGHTSGITKMEVFEGGILVTSSYDRTLRFWQLNNKSSVIASFVQTFDRWPLTFDLDRDNMVLWTGTQDGYMTHFCVDVEQNANDVRSSLKREFTADEWNYYVGPQIPQQFFLKGGER